LIGVRPFEKRLGVLIRVTGSRSETGVVWDRIDTETGTVNQPPAASRTGSLAAGARRTVGSPMAPSRLITDITQQRLQFGDAFPGRRQIGAGFPRRSDPREQRQGPATVGSRLHRVP
jgi:hypothetical protein